MSSPVQVPVVSMPLSSADVSLSDGFMINGSLPSSGPISPLLGSSDSSPAVHVLPPSPVQVPVVFMPLSSTDVLLSDGFLINGSLPSSGPISPLLGSSDSSPAVHVLPLIQVPHSPAFRHHRGVQEYQPTAAARRARGTSSSRHGGRGHHSSGQVNGLPPLFPRAPGRSPVMVASLDGSTAAVLPVDEDARRREIRLGKRPVEDTSLLHSQHGD
jgi:hypothetical protein